MIGSQEIGLSSRRLLGGQKSANTWAHDSTHGSQRIMYHKYRPTQRPQTDTHPGLHRQTGRGKGQHRKAKGASL